MGGIISGSSIQLHWSTYLSPIPCSFYHFCSVALPEVRDTDSNRSPFLIENSLSYPVFVVVVVAVVFVFCYSRWNWELLFLTLWRIELGFWCGLHWICRLLLAIWPLLLYWSCQSISMRDFSIFWGLLWFLSSDTWRLDSLVKQIFFFVWLESHQVTLCCLWLFWRCHFSNFYFVLFILWV